MSLRKGKMKHELWLPRPQAARIQVSYTLFNTSFVSASLWCCSLTFVLLHHSRSTRVCARLTRINSSVYFGIALWAGDAMIDEIIMLFSVSDIVCFKVNYVPVDRGVKCWRRQQCKRNEHIMDNVTHSCPPRHSVELIMERHKLPLITPNGCCLLLPPPSSPMKLDI